MFAPVPTLTLCRYAGMIVEVTHINAEKRRAIVRALRGRPFGCDGSDVTSDVTNVALSYLEDIQQVGMAEAMQPIPVTLPHVVVDAPFFS